MELSSLEISRDGLADMSDPENRPQVYVQGGNIKTTAKPVSSSTNKVIVKFSPALTLKLVFYGVWCNDVYGSSRQCSKLTHNFKVSAVNVANEQQVVPSYSSTVWQLANTKNYIQC